MSNETGRAYSRGYFNAANKLWHRHKPPYPPEPLVRNLMEAAVALRDAIDAQCATFEEDDEMVLALNSPIKGVDDALASISDWLSSKES